MLECKLEMNKSILAALLALSLVTGAAASPPARNELGLSHKLISGNPIAVEITLKPKRLFDGVAVEAGSGVAAVTPPCAFAAVTEGGSYVCRFEVTGNSADAAMTVNIVAQHVPSVNAQVMMEIHHLTFRNPGFIRSTAPHSSRHVLESTAAPQG
jgi:hypothetical protein